MKKKIIAIIACVAVIAAGIGLYFYFKPDATDGEKTVFLTISGDGKSETYEVSTDAETFGEMLVEEGFVENNQEEFGLYIRTVYGPFKDGRTVDDAKEEWWNLTKGGEALMTGADKTPIADGDKFGLELMAGYDNF